jgi:hypothetical protein
MIDNDPKGDEYYYPQWIRDSFKRERWPKMNQSMFTPQKGPTTTYEECFNMWIWTIGKREAGYWRPDTEEEMKEYSRKYFEHTGEEIPGWLRNKIGCLYDVRTPQEIEMLEEAQMLIDATIDVKIQELRSSWKNRKIPLSPREMEIREKEKIEMLMLEYRELPYTSKSNTWKWSASSDSEDEEEDCEFSDDDVPFGDRRGIMISWCLSCLRKKEFL